MKNNVEKKTKKKWSKRKKIIVSVFSISLITAFAFGVGFGFGYTDPKLSRPLKVDDFYSTWMSNIKDETKLTEVVLPGSHDAGSNKMMPQAMTQGHDIKDQLRGGVRYFDIRVTDKKDDLVIFHGPIKGQKYSKVANEIKEFINLHPSEFLILDFQHLGSGVNKDVIDMTKNILPMNKMLIYEDYKDVSNITFKELRDNSINFMIVWNNDEEALMNNFYTRDKSLSSQYDGDIHKKSDEALIKNFDKYYSNHDPKRMFVLQAQRTAKTLLGKPSEYEKKFDAKVTNYIKEIKNKPEILSKTNIIMRDFIVSRKEKVDTILDLNISKNLVKENKVSEFKEIIK